MIRMMTVNKDDDGNSVILFKLTEPRPVHDEEGKEVGDDDRVPKLALKMNLSDNIWRALGYTGSLLNVERDRFKNGPVYMQLTIRQTGKEKWKILKVQRFTPLENGTIEVLPIPELAEV